MFERILRLREAKRAAKRGRFRDALEALAAPAIAGHRDALDLKDRVFAQLVRAAGEAIDAGDLPRAREALTIARAAGCDSDEASQLMVRLTAAERAVTTNDRARRAILGEVRDRMAAGSVIGAQERLSNLTQEKDSAAAEMRRWVETETRDLERNLERCREAIAEDAPERASESLRRAAARFPTNPDVRALRREVKALERKHALARALRTIRESDDPGPALQTILLEHPDFAEHKEIRKFREKAAKRSLAEANREIVNGNPDGALAALEPTLCDPTAAPLLTPIRLWIRGRELNKSGSPAQAIALLEAAAARLGSTRTLESELDQMKARIHRRDDVLGRVTTSLESGDHVAAAAALDEMIEDGPAAEWLLALRREVGSRLDAGQAALIEVRKQVEEGRTSTARLALITLLSRRETRAGALELWRRIDERERRSAALLGAAESILLDVERNKAGLIEAAAQVSEAKRLQADHPQLKVIQEHTKSALAACEAYDEAVQFHANGQNDRALDRCDDGLNADPTHRALSVLREQIATRLSTTLLEQAERLAVSPQRTEARTLLKRVQKLSPPGSPSVTRAIHLMQLCDAAPSAPAAPVMPPEETARDRFVLRVEEGPEALVLTGDEIRIGNARDPKNDIALMANISSHHATITRALSFHGGVSYTIRAADGKAMKVNGESRREAEIADGDRIALGQDVELVVRFPDRGSVTMLLEIERGYRVEDIKAILLLKGPGKDGRIRIGSGDKVHLRTTNAAGMADLFQNDDRAEGAPLLIIESEQGLEVDGTYHRTSAVADIGAYVRSGECCFQVGRFAR